MKFTCASGQRVLNAYTIKRGVGRGGFGEVYYALSDGGKEVALKRVAGENLDVEMRGMAQCLNLKHPNLLALYDLRADDQGESWVVMEYIAGESLHDVLERHPQGLPLELVRQWFLDLARGVAHLHDQGIVHRDLKPANIFLESGTIKVGDYGLSKFISSSRHVAQTQSIGTVHYMAPEISTGNYNKQVDVYAAGVILYEMLTGEVPFDGESVGEILMKHLTAPPDLSKLPGEYAVIVGKALAKDPAHRYANMAEMAKSVERGAWSVERENVERGAWSVERETPNVGRDTPTASYPPSPSPLAPRPSPLDVLPVNTRRLRVGELCGSLALSAVLAGLFSILWASLGRVGDLVEVGTGFFLTVAVCWAVLIPAKFWDGSTGEPLLRRSVLLVLGLLIGLGAVWLDGWPLAAWFSWSFPSHAGGGVSASSAEEGSFLVPASYMSYFGLAFFTVSWWKMADRRRSRRFGLFPMIAVGFWAVVLLLVWSWAHTPRTQGAVALVLASAIIQLVSPWQPPPPPPVRPKRMRYP